MTRRDPDPGNMAGHEIQDDSEESPCYLQQHVGYAGHAGQDACYDGTQQVKQTQKIPYAHRQLVDVNIQAARAEHRLFQEKQQLGIKSDEEIIPQIKQPETALLNWRIFVDTQQSTRNKLMYGQVNTQVGNHKLWGFITCQEFNNHLRTCDRARARLFRDEINTDYQLQYNQHIGAFDTNFWLPKTQNNETIGGFYIIAVIDFEKNERLLFPVLDGQLQAVRCVKIIPVNTIKL